MHPIRLKESYNNSTTGKIKKEVVRMFYSLDVQVFKDSSLQMYFEDLFKNKTKIDDDQRAVDVKLENFALPQVLILNLKRDISSGFQFLFPCDLKLSHAFDIKTNQFKLLSFLVDEHICHTECKEQIHYKYVLYTDHSLNNVWFRCTEGVMTRCLIDIVISKSFMNACMLVYVNDESRSFSDPKHTTIPDQLIDLLNKEIIIA